MRKLLKSSEDFWSFSGFSRKMVVYSSTKFGIRKPWKKILSLRTLNLGFSQTSKQIYRKLQFREKVFGEFEALPRFRRKMILNSSSKFGILKPEKILHGPQHSIESFYRLQINFMRNSNIGRGLLKSYKVFLAFPDE